MMLPPWHLPSRQRKRKINTLIVDDERKILAFADSVLQDAGYVTWLALNGPQAVALAEHAGRIDVLVTDVQMPDVDGDELGTAKRDAPVTRLLKLFPLMGKWIPTEKFVCHHKRDFVVEYEPLNGLGHINVLAATSSDAITRRMND